MGNFNLQEVLTTLDESDNFRDLGSQLEPLLKLRWHMVIGGLPMSVSIPSASAYKRYNVVDYEKITNLGLIAKLMKISDFSYQALHEETGWPVWTPQDWMLAFNNKYKTRILYDGSGEPQAYALYTSSMNIDQGAGSIIQLGGWASCLRGDDREHVFKKRFMQGLLQELNQYGSIVVEVPYLYSGHCGIFEGDPHRARKRVNYFLRDLGFEDIREKVELKSILTALGKPWEIETQELRIFTADNGKLYFFPWGNKEHKKEMLIRRAANLVPYCLQ